VLALALHTNMNRLEKLDRVKHSSLLRKSVYFTDLRTKKFYNIGPRCQSYKTFLPCNLSQGVIAFTCSAVAIRVTRRLVKKNRPNYRKSSPNSCQIKKCQNIFIKAQFESQKHLHQTPSKLLKYPEQTIFSEKTTPWAFKK
jgi:hypothetical protein